MYSAHGGGGGGGGGGGREEQPRGFLAELAQAVTPRAALLVLGVLALQLGFVLSYVGAFHQPEPRDVPIAVVAPEPVRSQLTDRLDALPGHPLDTGHRAADEQAARQELLRRGIDAALLVDPDGTTDTLLVATGAGSSLAQAVTEVLRAVAADQDRELAVEDVAPAASGDSRGLTAFYLVVGWCVGGYLCAAVLAISRGARPATTARAVIRLLVLLVYALAAGLGGALITGPVLDALPGGIVATALVGALVVLATGATTLALQGLLGVAGIGVAILLVVVLGNPSAGGAYPGPLLPDFWREIGPALIPGAGTWLVRSVAYFDGHAVTGPLLVLAAWTVAGAVLTVLAARFRGAAAGRR
ncbi:DUF3533 domain-containing protein [Streptomyces lonarensis]|uniref:DUF3533 domain-containing protein n=1 Tax=Streptomyces lonarensis TaxID=700599 RepID=A0A7X6D2V9_9ACTN|nr:DUF3533 domain-containing protein [Streptomyces lonarensis]NJQ07191.1 DUF3533 domain-containing protein [Streptomyces lonarensis]